jgi:Spy/CpxP family protein refolding chaperone
MQLSNRIKAAALSIAVLSSMGLGIAMAQTSGDNASAPAVGAQGQPGGHHGKHMGGKNRGDFKAKREAFEKELGLTDAQKQQMKAQHEAFRTQNKAAIDSMHAKFKELRGLEKTPENQQKRQQLMASLKQDRQALHAKREASMQNVLTPEQMTKFKAMKEQRKQEWQQRRAARQQKAN